MNVLIDSFLDYLRYERNYSEYTINAYFKDLQQFEDFVKEKKEGIFVPEEVDTDIVRNWIISLWIIRFRRICQSEIEFFEIFF